MTTLQRRLLGVASRFGAKITNLWPGTVVLSRSRSGTDSDKLRVRKIGEDTVLVSRNADVQAQEITDGATLMWQPSVTRQKVHQFQKGLFGVIGTEHIAWVLRLFDVNCVLDVGANNGQYAKQLRKAGYKGRIVSFEPLPHIVEKLEKAAAKDKNWWVYPYALGREDTTTEMTVVQGTMSSLLGPTEYGSKRYKRFENSTVEEVQVRRLAGLLDEIFEGIDEPRPYLKLDTQGFDLEAFAGTEERIKQFVGMQSEVALLQIYEGMPNMRESIQAYEDAGFEITGMFPVSREGKTARVVEYDCVMVRADAARPS